MFSNLAKILQDPEKVNSLELLGSKDCSFVYFTQVFPMESKKKEVCELHFSHLSER